MSSAALKTDLYQLTMAAGYFHRDLADTVATCEMFVRRLPKQRRYLVANGIEAALDAIVGLRFDEEQIDYLRELPALRDAMDDAFVQYLRDYRFSGEVWAVDEGTVMFGGAPFMRVTAPIIEAQIIETFILSTINHGTMIASKAARVVRAASGRAVLEFGTRRTHPDEAVGSARAAYLVGAAGTSNVEAGHRYSIPVLGTASHMWTMAHDSEEQAFDNYVKTFPNASILLIDTYDTVRGAHRAADIAKDKLEGVRLDSGDLLELSKAVRGVLDAEGCPAAKIVASGDLNEYKIAELLAGGAPIDVFGVGTELVCSKDAPSLGGVYKVVQYERAGRVVPIMKLAEGKATYPGPHQIYRGGDGDLLTLADEDPPADMVPLLKQRIADGERTTSAVSLADCRYHAMAELDALDDELHRFEPLAQYASPIDISPGVVALCDRVKEARA